jgi:hypothetical protein
MAVLSLLGFGTPAQRQELYRKELFINVVLIVYRDLEAALVNNQHRNRIFDETNDFVRPTHSDRIKTVASRMLHSEFYKWFYVAISVLSIFALIIVNFLFMNTSLNLSSPSITNGSIWNRLIHADLFLVTPGCI